LGTLTGQFLNRPITLRRSRGAASSYPRELAASD
jgi:hypothetical protein